MASPAPEVPIADNTSDYGSDFSPEEEEIIGDLLANPIQILEDDNPILPDIEDHEPPSSLRIPRLTTSQERSPLFQAARSAQQVAEQISRSIQGSVWYPDLANLPDETVSDVTETTIAPDVPVESKEEKADTLPDLRSPLQRFRTPPKKPFSVTDLVSPAWCELQYWYTLTKHGRKRRTPAMKQGSVVHQMLEDQVHETRQVDIKTREDGWGLRIWNVIIGLRTLRDTGLTRELEIWGTVDGYVVNGIIDELSYICPDQVLEESFSASPTQDQSPPAPPPDQPTISEFFKASGGKTLKEATRSPKRRTRMKKIYICDVKTRGVASLPSKAAFKPTEVQLMLYHRLLSELAANSVDFSVLTARYNLDPQQPFSDSFLAQMSEISNEHFYSASSSQSSSPDSEPNWTQDSLDTLLAHNNLNSLWSLMISEFQLTLPEGSSSLGKVLKAEYRSRDDGEVLGSKTILMDQEGLSKYIEKEMEWWKGEREAVGVRVEEAFKCRSCEFSEECEWRIKKVDEAREKARLNKRRKATI